MKKIPLIKPYITQEVKDRVCEVLESGFLTEGSITKEFEEAIMVYTGCSHAIAVTSCTTGLETALRAIGIKPGDEVIVPDYTYPATADVVSLLGAKTVIVDVNPDTMLIDYDQLEEAVTKSTKAVIPVSLFGNPLDYNRLNTLKEKYSLFIIEDAACSLGASFRNTRVGNLADISVFSFHPRKFITTGEGGMITTNHKNLAEWMDSFKHFGIGNSESRQGTVFKNIGTNYKLSNVLSAIGLAQMSCIDNMLDRRRLLASNYKKAFAQNSRIKIPGTTEGGIHSYQSFCIFIEGRDRVMNEMREDGIEVQIGTYSLHMQPAFKDNPSCRFYGDMHGSRYSFENCLALPLYHEMTETDQKTVIESLIRCLDKR